MLREAAALALLALLSGGAGAQSRITYCCTDDAGRQVCGDILPALCYGRAYRVIDERGITVRSVEAPLTPAQRAQREAEARRKREQERAAAEERRRNQALLDAYASEADIDRVRDRILHDIESGMQEAQDKHAAAAKRHKELMDEMEFYKKKVPPKQLADAVRESESELRAHQSVIDAKQKEMEAVRARYDEDKRRYIEITRGRGAAPGEAQPR